MRELKFRTWDEADGLHRDEGSMSYGITDVKCDATAVMQYTGLADNNLKEIYEGDILKVTSLDNDHNQRGGTEVLIVRFFMGNACMCFPDCEPGKPIYPSLNMKKEVIGNIYENPELI